MKFICDKCGFCRNSDDQHKDIWVSMKIGDKYDVGHYCYDCGKQMIDTIEANLPKIERIGDEDEY